MEERSAMEQPTPTQPQGQAQAQGQGHAHDVRLVRRVWLGVVGLSLAMYVVYLLLRDAEATKRVLLSGLALGQAWLILGYTMGLRFERLSLRYVVLLPLLLLALLAVFFIGEGSYVQGVRRIFFEP